MIQHCTDYTCCDGCRQWRPASVEVQYDSPYPAGSPFGKLCEDCASLPPQSYRLISMQVSWGWVNVEHRLMRCTVDGQSEKASPTVLIGLTRRAA